MNDDITKVWKRILHMAKVRRKEAQRYYKKDSESGFDTAIVMDTVAEAYERCAREIERVINGEVPPEVGENWPENTRINYE